MADKWILRKGSKDDGFRYTGPDGKAIRAKGKLERIDLLRIPPAWQDVHIAANPRAAIQVWGLDARARKQYRYHARAVQKGQLRKYYRVRQMANDLPGIRKKFDNDFSARGFTRDKVCAAIMLLISDSFFRVGSERYERENSTFGLTTLKKSHVSVYRDRLIFDYVGKRNIPQKQTVTRGGIAELTSADMAVFIRSLLKKPGDRLFRYKANGVWADVDATDVNDYLQEIAGFPYTAKDFRTWGGTLRTATVLADIGSAPSRTARNRIVVTAVRLVASELGNTPAIVRKSYVHPVVISRFLKSGETIVAPHAPKARRSAVDQLLPEEKALVRFLDTHFPERRSERRER
ncbi:MAG: hypothetical protein WKF55_14710 [Gemmatimonadaceae bacterium]